MNRPEPRPELPVKDDGISSCSTENACVRMGISPELLEIGSSSAFRKCTLPTPVMSDLLMDGSAWALIDGQASPDVGGHAERLGPGAWAAVTVPDVDVETRFMPPVLVRPDAKTMRFLDGLSPEDGPWGYAVLPAAGATLGDVTEHLRSWAMVIADQPEPVLFRFQDSRVIAAFLSAAEPADALSLFGAAIAAFLLPDEGAAETVTVFLPPDADPGAAQAVARDEAGLFVMQPRHLEALGAIRLGMAVPSLHAFLAEYHGAELAQRAADLPGQRRWVNESLGKAAGHGFETEYDIALFLALMLVLGDGFDKDFPWAAPILDATAPPNERIKRLYDRAKAHLSQGG